MWGFDSFKDWLDVLIIPGAIFALGALFPWWARRQRRRTFLQLIRQELGEMEPDPEHKKPDGGRWPEHLRKRFIHQAIFLRPSENRDFILSLPPDFAYYEAQLWTEYEKGTEAKNDADLAYHGARWCDYLRKVCRHIDGRSRETYYKKTCAPWEQLISEYHP